MTLDARDVVLDPEGHTSAAIVTATATPATMNDAVATFPADFASSMSRSPSGPHPDASQSALESSHFERALSPKYEPTPTPTALMPAPAITIQGRALRDG